MLPRQFNIFEEFFKIPCNIASLPERKCDLISGFLFPKAHDSRQFNGCKVVFLSVSSRTALTTPRAHIVIPAYLVTMATPLMGHLRTVSPVPAHSIFLATSRFLKRLTMTTEFNQTLQSITADTRASLTLWPLFSRFDPSLHNVFLSSLFLSVPDMNKDFITVGRNIIVMT